MKRGKKICETLKAIRSEIASANEIDYTPTECNHEGNCAGTCPKCEQETRWLERQLRNRQALGKAVTIAGLSLALGTLTSCNNSSSSKDASSSSSSPLSTNETFPSNENEDVDGYLDDTDTCFTALPGSNEEGVSSKGSGNDQEAFIAGEVIVPPEYVDKDSL